MADKQSVEENPVSELVENLARAIRDRTAFPPMPSKLSLNDAYAMQAELVQAVSGGAIAGYKAGLTAPAGQAQFGIDHPLIGVLYSAGRLQSGASFSSGPGVMLECEIGVVIDADGNARTAGPVIEVPRAAWGRPEDATGINMAASNIAADRFITGEQAEIRDDYDDLAVILTRDGETVTQAPLHEALGGPLPALQWMTSSARELGRPLQDGMLMITGAVGGIQPAQPGAYVADYGVLGKITFTVT